MFAMRGVRRTDAEIGSVLDLRRGGSTIAAISRSTGLPYGTVKNWCRGDVPSPVGERCKACGDLVHEDLPRERYAYLLGIYLGDGCLSTAGGGAWLCVSCDAAYPGIIAECRHAITAIAPHRRSNTSKAKLSNCVTVRSYAPLWLCLFPQHGAGRKHHRPIVLQPWQREIADQHPGALLRGLIHSDGWRGSNRVSVGGKSYSYPRYQFSNRSDDIRSIFTGACDRLGVAWRPWGRWNISVARRDSVALLDRFVGPKS